MASVVIDIASEFTGKKAFKQAEGATDKLGKSVKSLAKTFGLAFSVGAVLAYAKASVKAAADDQKAQQQLALALKNVGLGREAASAERFIQQLQSEFAVVDDLLRPSYQKLAVATKNTAETQRLLGIALDISASTGKDLDSVTGALSKAYLGNNTALGKLGVGISKTDLKSKSFKEITDDLAKTFKGSAKAASETFAGSIAKLGVASENVKEIIGTGLIDALKGLGDDTTVADLATNMENLAIYTADVIRGFGLMAAALKKIPGLSGLTGASIVQAIPILGSYITLLNQAGAQARRAAEVGAQKNPIQSGSYLTTQKKITTLTKEQQKAQAKILADKKSQAILDKANLALAKGNDVFNMDAIQLNAALIGQAEALGKATTGSQILAIANDVQRLKVKQDIAALEDAIASKDEAAIVKATAKLNEDLKILGALQKQDFTLLGIKTILDSLKPKELIDQENLNMALAKIKEMLDLLAKVSGTTTKTTSTTALTPFEKFVSNQPLSKSTADLFAELKSDTDWWQKNGDTFEGFTPFVGMKIDSNGGAATSMPSTVGLGTSGTGRQIPVEANYTVNVNAGIVGSEDVIVDAVQNALNEIARRGYTTTYAGAIAV